jgi:hypothetical protein
MKHACVLWARNDHFPDALDQRIARNVAARLILTANRETKTLQLRCRAGAVVVVVCVLNEASWCSATNINYDVVLANACKDDAKKFCDDANLYPEPGSVITCLR